MKSRIFQLIIFITAVILIPTQLLAVSANPQPVTKKQPDGTEITIRSIGDEYYSFTETIEGYAITKNADGWWVYADLDETDRYKPTQYRVGKDEPQAKSFLNSIEKHLREDRKDTDALRYRIDLALEDLCKEVANTFREKGRWDVNIPVFLVEFRGFGNDHTETAQSFDDMFNFLGYDGPGCISEYFREVSYENLNITGQIFNTWYEASENKGFYGERSQDACNTQCTDLVIETINKADDDFSPDWSIFDNNGDDEVEVVIIVYQGEPATSALDDLIWPHTGWLNKSWMSGVGCGDHHIEIDGFTIDRYILVPELNTAGNHVEIGVVCHELGHGLLGLPDLYDRDNTSDGIGIWGLMGNGNWGGNLASPERPTHLCAWSKIEVGWIDPVVPVDFGKSGKANTWNIPPVEENPTTIYSVWTYQPGVDLTEYFLVENRQQIGFDMLLPNSGLAIWHIDRSRRTNDPTIRGNNDDETHKLVDLEEADNGNELDVDFRFDGEAGGPGDLFPGTTGNTDFHDDDDTPPNSLDYGNNETKVCVDGITPDALPSTDIKADFCVPVPVNPPDFLIRDCSKDEGDEPDGQCTGDWVKSPDIWIDNEDAGTLTDPDPGHINHLYIRTWNTGGSTYDATVKCWFARPGLGLIWPPPDDPETPEVDDYRIIHEVTGQDFVTVRTPGHLEPTEHGLGHRVYFAWTIPEPPPEVNHYCIGCAVGNDYDQPETETPGVHIRPLQDNNLAQINMWALAGRVGDAPDKFNKSTSDQTVFRQEVNVNNPYDVASNFLVVVEDLEPDYTVDPGTEVEVFLEAYGSTSITFDVTNESSEHKDSTPVSFKLYKLPEYELAGGLHNDLLIDDVQPTEVPGFVVQLADYYTDWEILPWPKYEITWFKPTEDIAGYDERIRYFEIHASTNPALLYDPDDMTLIEHTALDANPSKPGFQYYYFDPSDQITYFTIIAADIADNKSDPVPPQTAPEESGPIVGLEKLHDMLQGHFAYVRLTTERSIREMGGFDFLIAYDASALTFMEATPGQLLEDCGWEYFTYRHGVHGNCGDACPSGLLRIVAMAETNDGPNHPSCFGPPDTDPHELAVMKFHVTNDRTFSCQYVPIYFFWDDCGDNSISSVDGETLYIDRAIYDFNGNLIWDEENDDEFPEDARIPFVGAPDYCMNPDPNKPDPVRIIDFVNGGIDIICADSIDAKGDVNCDGVAWAIADIVVFINYYIYGLAAFDGHVECSIAASDIDNNGVPLTIADLVYLIRILVGDALPDPKVAPVEAEYAVNYGVLSVNCELGAAHMVIRGKANPANMTGNMEMKADYDKDSDETHVLLYSMEKGQTFEGDFLKFDGILLEIEAATYDGAMVKFTSDLLPKEFILHQNRPNPFNPITGISFSLPVASEVTLEIYNINGQKVATVAKDHFEAGTHTVEWNGTNYASGVYLYKITAGDFTDTKKMLLLK